MITFGNESVLDERWNISQEAALNESTNGTSSNGYGNSATPLNYAKLTYMFIAVLGIVGNGVVIVVISHSVSMRHKFTNILILNQSSIDLITSVLILMTKSHKFSRKNLSGIGGEILCRFWISEFPLWSLMVSSSYNLMALTFERYLGIVHPLFHHTFSSRTKVLVLASAAWCAGPILKLCFLVTTSGLVNNHCRIMSIYANVSLKKACGVALFALEYLLPIAVFITCYTRMFVRLRSQVHPQATNIANEISIPNSRARRIVLKTLMLVVVGYLLCNSSNQLTFLAYNFGAPLNFGGYYYNFTVIAMFANCCINPFLYALQYGPYQNELRKVFCKCNTPLVVVTS